MPRWARSSARCGPTPLIMRTSVLRLMAIAYGARKTGDVYGASKTGDCIIFISFQPGTYCNCETCFSALRTDRVRIPCRKQGGSSDGRTSDRLGQARAAFVDGCRNSRNCIRAEILFPGVPGSVR